MTIKSILVSQPEPGNTVSPFSEITAKYGVKVDYFPFYHKTPDCQRVQTSESEYSGLYRHLLFSQVIYRCLFLHCEELRITVPDAQKYFCTTEAIALYLQKHITYRKRKIFFGTGTTDSVINVIGTKHKNETFLIASTDTTKPEVIKAFTKAGLKFGNAVLSKSVYSDLSKVDISSYQMVVFYSPQDVKSLMDNYPDFKQENLLFVTYGPSTAKAVKEAGFDIEVMAPTPQVSSVSKALLLYLEGLQ